MGLKREFDDVLLLFDKLTEYLNIPCHHIHHIAIVPGNHDINRDTRLSYFAECKGDERKPAPPYGPK